jgi:hypothetical protein
VNGATVNNAFEGIAIIDATNKAVTLTLANAVTGGNAVLISYTDPTTDNDTKAIQDATGNDALVASRTSL